MLSELLELRVLRRRYRRRRVESLEMGIKERTEAVRCNGQLPACVDLEPPQEAHHSSHEAALPHGAVVTEHEVKGASDFQREPSVGRQAIVDGLDVGLDLTRLRIRVAAMIAQQEHERLSKAGFNHPAVRRTVDVYAHFATRVDAAKLGDRSTAE